MSQQGTGQQKCETALSHIYPKLVLTGSTLLLPFAKARVGEPSY